jgi:hypothetical protein
MSNGTRLESVRILKLEEMSEKKPEAAPEPPKPTKTTSGVEIPF